MIEIKMHKVFNEHEAKVTTIYELPFIIDSPEKLKLARKIKETIDREDKK